MIGRVIGFLLSVLLTLLAYYVILHPDFFGLYAKGAVIVIFVLALLQALVQLAFFIDVWKEKGGLWNLSVFVSTVSIIFVVIFFSIWIINHLNDNMH